jgi:hypothetical protein
MDFDTIAELNYHLDHEIAQAFGLTLDEVDALPLTVIEELRSAQVQVEESRKSWILSPVSRPAAKNN